MTTWSFRSAFKALGVAASLALAYMFALLSIRSYFAWYDDEGFMLMTLRQYIGGLPLYDKMYTEYGPFYYVFESSLFRLAGWSGTHDQARWLTIMMWLAVGTGWALCVWAWSRSYFWATAALLATVVVLRNLNREPGHPQTTVLILYAFAFLAVSAYRKLPDSLVFAALGGVSAAMTLTKINIGIFMCAALVAVFTSCLPMDRLTRSFTVFVHAMCIALPAVLMHRHFMEPTAVVQCTVYTFGIWATLYVLRRSARPELTWLAVVWGAIGFFGVGLLTVMTVVFQGTSLYGVLEGVVLLPLRFSKDISFEATSGTRTLVGLLGVACTLLYARQRLNKRAYTQLRVMAAGAAIVLTVISPPLGTSIAPAILWMFLPDPGRTLWKSSSGMPVFLVVVAATFAVLMGYPVSGTQLFVAASIVLLAAFAPLLQQAQPVVCGLILVTTFGTGIWTLASRPAITASSHHLPNSQLIQFSTGDYAVYSEITARTSALCDTLVTIPGMNSFHIWSGVPHPNGFVLSAAMVLFDVPAQEQLRKDFLSSQRPCVIFNPGLELWGAHFRPTRPNQPFIDLVKNGLVSVYSRNGYEIRVPPNQAFAWR